MARLGYCGDGFEACAINTAAAADSRSFASRKREPCSLLASSPPAGKGTMKRIGRDGYSCATAPKAVSAAPTANQRATTNLQYAGHAAVEMHARARHIARRSGAEKYDDVGRFFGFPESPQRNRLRFL